MQKQNDSVNENLVGKIAVCKSGIVGQIEGQKNLDWGLAWVGSRLDDGGPWSSRYPKIIANSLDEYNDQLAQEFGFDDNDDEEYLNEEDD